MKLEFKTFEEIDFNARYSVVRLNTGNLEELYPDVLILLNKIVKVKPFYILKWKGRSRVVHEGRRVRAECVTVYIEGNSDEYEIPVECLQPLPSLQEILESD